MDRTRRRGRERSRLQPDTYKKTNKIAETHSTRKT